MVELLRHLFCSTSFFAILSRLPILPDSPPTDDEPASGLLPLAEPDIDDTARQLVWKALEDPVIAAGPSAKAFERAVGELLGGRPAVAVNSGTSALHLGLLAVGVRPGDAVLLPALTFVAPANAIRYAGATPIAFDSEPDYWQLDVARLQQWLTRECTTSDGATHRASGRRIGAIVPVDLLGHPTDVDALRDVVAQYGIPIVQDAAEALGAELHGKPIGASADVVCLSFNANKIVTSGGGGMLLTGDAEVAERMRRLANQAKIASAGYDHDEVGFNYLMPSAPAALGLAQLARLGEFLLAKRAIAAHYARELEEVPGIALPREAPWARATYWLYTIHVDPALYGRGAAQLHEQLELQQIQSRRMFTPLHLTAAHAGCAAEPCPVAEHLSATGLTLPTSSKLQPKQLARVTDAIRAGAA